MVGFGLTVTVEAAVLLQPLTSVPVTVYDVVDDNTGVVTVAPFGKPPVHVYVDAPDAFSVAVCPEQITGELTVTVGLRLTFTVEIAELLQPFASVPVTV